MQLVLPIEQMDDFNDKALAGFCLQRFEVLNWGTFDQRPWVLDLQGNIALLTGANGSGKSTLVDGLLTLLVANQRRNYNQASSMTGKKERHEKSYVQGAYSHTRDEEFHRSKSKVLRDKGKPSVLLGYFSDRLSKQDVTLAQVLWMEDGSVKKFFVVADAELTIASHFTQFTRIADLKKQLKALGAETFDKFVDYSQQFRKRFGLESEKALDLFNQTVSIKEIGGLNDFVRNHMLEKADVQTKIRELQESYENLTISHTAIQNARKQLEALLPLTAEAEKYTKLKKEVAKYQESKDVAPAFFASKKLDLLTQELQKIEQHLTQLQHQRVESDRRLSELRDQEKQLYSAIDKDSDGQRLQELTREIKQCQDEVNRKRTQAQNYDRLAQLLNLTQYTDSTIFYANRIQGEELKREIDTALQKLEAQRDQQITLRSDLQKQHAKLNDELESLRSRKSQIPKRSLDIRDRLVRDLNLNDTDLPFVGELLQIRKEAQEWEGAIERLLSGFGLSVLVPEAHYQAVNAYVNQTDLKGRLVYYHVTASTPNPTQRDLKHHHVPHKLEIKQDNGRFSYWLRDELVRQFNYVCCDEEQFQHEIRAITRTGLMKHGKERHEKDDRFRISDRSHYILGWNNASKIKDFEAKLSLVNQELAQIDKQVQSLKRQHNQRLEQTSWLQNLMNYGNFNEIDWRSTQLECQNLQKQKQQLEASSDHLKQLKAQLESTKEEIVQAKKRDESLIGEIRTLEDRQRYAQTEQSHCENKLQSVAASAIEEFATRMAAKLRQYKMTLDAIAQDESELQKHLDKELRQKEQQQNDSRSALQMRMLNFKNAFSEITVELGTTLDFLDEYLKLKTQIEHDDLPRHEERFKRLMTGKVIEAIVGFKGQLEKQEEEIQENIDELNKSLRQVDYTDYTYIELCYEPSRNREIRDFKQDLNICLGDVAHQTAEDNEQRFHNIRTRLIERFQSQEQRWTNLVTDVRNWLDFSVIERYRSDNIEKEHHTDSSGKSGGQKVKLAYTILASAIAYQFGLNQDTTKNKSFRFVVIDEAFSKSDDKNARYAMELFKNLNLQLLVVTPMDKIHVVEHYISSFHLIHNNTEGSYSGIISGTGIEEVREKVKGSLRT
ncbi:ATP-binding protein [Nostoc sp. ChiQUE01b]|uniref:ATP-binding protein n=1 Tax=Nostoc sp. ChiQUE01b TaxID=3075376 RepID=UPI002AD4E348|nr:SbcC/MukB-like Walker B domain-containing protein [Nostoc sp. ChiQUE01b]MDZ8262996.1 SbcC/MukB-like Walker B domain-containing protein [Nostoc sp. ChiQUE01b]